MNASTQKLTTAAACTALAVIMCVFTAYLPLSFMPLYVAAFCIFLACKRAGLFYGVLCALASVGLMFLMTGLSVKWLAFVFMFAPYGVITYFIHMFNYFKVKWGAIRGLIALLYFNATFGIVYAIAVNVLSVGIEGLNIVEWADIVGGYPVLAVIATLVLVPLDVMFSSMAIVVLKRIPAPVTRRKPPVSSAAPQNGGENADNNPSAQEQSEKKYDIFGYEITDDYKSGDDNDADKQ